jgi:hypothetical protein
VHMGPRLLPSSWDRVPGEYVAEPAPAVAAAAT